MIEACWCRSLLGASVAIVVGWMLQSTVSIVAAGIEETTTYEATTANTSNTTITFTNISDMTEKQRQSVITIEFRPTVASGDDVAPLSDEDYRRLRQVILDELNRQRRRIRRTTATQETTAATTTEITTTTVATTTETTTETREAPPPDIEYYLIRRRRAYDVDFDDYSDEDQQLSGAPVREGHRLSRRQADTSDDDDYYYYDSDYYTEDDLRFILLEPVVVDGVVRVAVALDKPGETDADPHLLLKAAQAVDANQQLDIAVGIPVKKIYRGLPNNPDTMPLAEASTARLDWRFLVAFFVIFVCFIILLAVICIRRRRQSIPPTIEEDKLLPATAPTHQRQPGNPGKPLINGNKHAPVGHLDNDDGYIVPYDVMVGVLACEHDDAQRPAESTKL